MLPECGHAAVIGTAVQRNAGKIAAEPSRSCWEQDGADATAEEEDCCADEAGSAWIWRTG
ncbi:hypothetical protein PMJ10TS2_13110 [Paenibacillus melissococcoides]